MPSTTATTAALSRRASWLALAVLPFVAAPSCFDNGTADNAASYSDPLDGANTDGKGVVPSGSGATMVTMFAESQVEAGTPVRVNCYVREGTSLFLPDTAIFVTVTPSAPGLEIGATSAVFTPSAAGTYHAFCRSADSSLVDLVGATIEVLPGAPSSWFVDLLDRDCYVQSLGLPIDFDVYDAYGNIIPNADVSLTTSPSTEVTRDSRGRFLIAAEGTFDITLAVEDALAPGASIEPFYATITVDSTPPAIVLTSPARGAMLQTGGYDDAPVTLTGVATDLGTPIVSLTVDGNTIPVDGTAMSKGFSVDGTSRWGMNLVSGTSEDACGNVGALGQAYLRSPTYFDPALSPSSGARVGGAALMQVNQSVLDDSDRTDVDDLATIVNTALAGLDFDALVYPGRMLGYDPLQLSCTQADCFLSFCTDMDIGYTVWRSPVVAETVTWNPPVIDSIQIVDGGVKLAAHMDRFSFPMRIWAGEQEVAWGCTADAHELTLDARMGFNRLDFGGTFGITIANGAPTVDFRGVQFAIDGAFLNVDCGSVLQGACDAATGFAMPYVESIVENMVQDALTNDVPPLLEQGIGGLSVAVCVQPPAPLDQAQLNVSATFDTVAFCGPNGGLNHPTACPAASPAQGFGWLGLGLQFYPSARGATIPASALGAIKKGGGLANFNTTLYDLGVGVKDDTLNQLLWALWYGGGFDVDLSDQLADVAPAGTQLTMSMALPPVIMPGRNDFELDFGVGDLYVSASLDLANFLGDAASEPIPFHVGAYVSLVMGGSIDIDSVRNELIVSIDPNAEAAVEITEIDAVASAYAGEISNFVAQVMRDELPGLLQDAIGTMPIPALEVGGLPGLPNNIYWGLGNTAISRTADYMALTGNVTARTVPGPIDSPDFVWHYACQ